MYLEYIGLYLTRHSGTWLWRLGIKHNTRARANLLCISVHISISLNYKNDRDGILKSLQIWNLLNFTSNTSSLHIRHSWQFLVDIFLRFSGVILSGKSGKLLLFPFEFGVSLVEDQDLFIIMRNFSLLLRIGNIVCLTFALESVTFCSVQSICSLHWLDLTLSLFKV